MKPVALKYPELNQNKLKSIPKEDNNEIIKYKTQINNLNNEKKELSEELTKIKNINNNLNTELEKTKNKIDNINVLSETKFLNLKFDKNNKPQAFSNLYKSFVEGILIKKRTTMFINMNICEKILLIEKQNIENGENVEIEEVNGSSMVDVVDLAEAESQKTTNTQKYELDSEDKKEFSFDNQIIEDEENEK